MSKKITYNFKVDGFYNSVNYYRGESPIDPLNLPVAHTTGITELSFTDETAQIDKIYHVRFGSVKGEIEKISNELIVSTVKPDILLDYFLPGVSGFYQDISDLITIYKDQSLTRANIGDKVGLVLDKSGNGNHWSQLDETKKPTLMFDSLNNSYYLNFTPGNFLTCASVNMTNTSDVFVSMAMLKELNGNSSVFIELSNSSDVNNGSFALLAYPQYSEQYDFFNKGAGSRQSVSLRLSNLAAPNYAVVTGVGRLNNSYNLVRANSVNTNLDSSSAGGGNYGNYPLYVGTRAGTSMFFKGRLYSAICIGKNLTSADIQIIEDKIKEKIKLSV